MTTERDLIQRLADVLTNAIRIIHNEDGTQHISTAIPALAEARALLSQPEPEGPTDDELDYLWTEIDGGPDCCAWRPYALAVRARWPLAAIEPVPVSERLPGPEDCMDEGWAWFYTPRGNWIKAVLPVSPAYTHWLPHYALPVPTTTETP